MENEQNEDDSRWSPTCEPTDKDIQESIRTATDCRAEPKQCFANSVRAIRNLPDYQEASYLEGFAITIYGLPFDHAWIVKDGLIIDPTLPTDTLRYIPGLEFAGVRGIDEFLSAIEPESHHKPFHWAFGFAGQLSPHWCRAFLAANAHNEGFVPPPSMVTRARKATLPLR